MNKQFLELGIAEIVKLHEAQEALANAGLSLGEDNVLFTAEDTILKMLEIGFKDEEGVIGEFIYEADMCEDGSYDYGAPDGCLFCIANLYDLWEVLDHNLNGCSDQEWPVEEDIGEPDVNEAEEPCPDCTEGFCANCHCPHCQEDLLNEEELNDVLDAFDALITLRNFFF